jgi:hypothetical protein
MRDDTAMWKCSPLLAPASSLSPHQTMPGIWVRIWILGASTGANGVSRGTSTRVDGSTTLCDASPEILPHFDYLRHYHNICVHPIDDRQQRGLPSL